MKTAAVKKGHTASSKKKPKGDALKTFFSQTIARTDDTGERVRKDELYELFARFCRDHRITPVPERKAVTVALKNQFALTEKTGERDTVLDRYPAEIAYFLFLKEKMRRCVHTRVRDWNRNSIEFLILILRSPPLAPPVPQGGGTHWMRRSEFAELV